MNSERSDHKMSFFPAPPFAAPADISDDIGQSYTPPLLSADLSPFLDYPKKVQICSEPSDNQIEKCSVASVTASPLTAEISSLNKGSAGPSETASISAATNVENSISAAGNKKVPVESAESAEKGLTDNSVDATSIVLEAIDTKNCEAQSEPMKVHGGSKAGESEIKARKRRYQEVYEAAKRFFGFDWKSESIRKAKQFPGTDSHLLTKTLEMNFTAAV